MSADDNVVAAVREVLAKLMSNSRKSLVFQDDAAISTALEAIDANLSALGADVGDAKVELARLLLNALSTSGLPKKIKHELSQRARSIWKGWEADYNAIKFIRKRNGDRVRIGNGAVADVYLASMPKRDENDHIIDSENMEVAVKQFILYRSITDEAFPNFMRRVFLLKEAQHPCIIRTFGAYWPASARYENEDDDIGPSIVMERMTYTLKDALVEGLLNSAEAKRRVLKDISAGIAHLHSTGIVHCDIKPENIMMRVVGGQIVGRVKLCNFHAARKADENDSISDTAEVITRPNGSFVYMAPEAFRISAQDSRKPSRDIWSLGMLLCEVIDPDFVSRINTALESTVSGWIGRAQHLSCDHALKNLLLSCLSLDSTKRPRIETVANLLQTVTLPSIETRISGSSGKPEKHEPSSGTGSFDEFHYESLPGSFGAPSPPGSNSDYDCSGALSPWLFGGSSPPESFGAPSSRAPSSRAPSSPRSFEAPTPPVLCRAASLPVSFGAPTPPVLCRAASLPGSFGAPSPPGSNSDYDCGGALPPWLFGAPSPGSFRAPSPPGSFGPKSFYGSFGALSQLPPPSCKPKSEKPKSCAPPPPPPKSENPKSCAQLSSTSGLCDSNEEVKRSLIALSRSGVPNDDKLKLSKVVREDWAGWKVDPSDVEFVRKKSGDRKRLGKGSYGDVYLGRMNLRCASAGIISRDPIEVAVKQFSISRMKAESSFSSFIRELFLQTHAEHPCIVKTFGGFWPAPGEVDEDGDPIPPIIIMERMSYDLDRAIDENLLDTLESKRRILCDIATGIAHLHSLGIVHRDIKPENVLVKVRNGRIDGKAKICDFGVSRKAEEPNLATNIQSRTVPIGTSIYMPPEASKGSPQDSSNLARDTWSYGILICQLLIPYFIEALARNYPEGVEVSQCGQFARKVAENIHNVSFDRELKGIAVSCLNLDPMLRPKMAGIEKQLASCIG